MFQRTCTLVLPNQPNYEAVGSERNFEYYKNLCD